MKNAFLMVCLAALAVLILLPGCAVSQGKNEGNAAGQAEDRNGRKLLEAFVGDRAEAFVGCLPEELQKQFGKDEFKEARNSLVKTLGKPVSFHFMAYLEHPLVTISVWKVCFERLSSEGKMIRQETLFRVISNNIGEESQIISFNFL